MKETVIERMERIGAAKRIATFNVKMAQRYSFKIGASAIRSAPFAIFNRQDLLELALELEVPVPEIYGEIVRDPDGTLRTTRAQRTGCSLCGFGIHLEKRPHRFDLLRERRPKEWERIMYHLARDEAGAWYGWGKILDYIGVEWRDIPAPVGEQLSLKFDEVSAR